MRRIVQERDVQARRIDAVEIAQIDRLRNVREHIVSAKRTVWQQRVAAHFCEN